MSELKAYIAYEAYDFPDETEFYLKYKADKVIAELEAENEMLRRDFERVEGRNTLNLVYTYGCQSIPEFHKMINDLIKRFNQNEKQLTNAKYKRCLLRSVIAEMNATHFKELFYDAGSEALADEYNKQITIHYKWHKRWLEFAEKFKEHK